VIGGEFDKYIAEVGDKILAFLNGPDGVWGTGDDRRMYIALSTEMNGNWRVWYGAPARFIAMYRKMVDILRSRIPQDGNTRTRLQFIWTINHKDVPGKAKGGYRAEQFYPGHKYVDWVGVDGYNWGIGKDLGWWSPVKVFKSIFGRLRKVGRGKPLAVVELGTSAQVKAGKFNVKKKNQWIKSSFKYFGKSRVRMVIFFNENKERDWENIGVTSKGDKKNSGYRYFSAWLKGLRNKFFIGSNRKNPRLISDKAFLGK
jgi:beta-mannanase